MKKGTETPPRAWGKRACNLKSGRKIGNTPTGVGKTRACVCRRRRPEKHPHGRGENFVVKITPLQPIETPPRAWGKPLNTVVVVLFNGNTPTGVGKTCQNELRHHCTEKHPHGRGENRFFFEFFLCAVETPPRAWGKLIYLFDKLVFQGNTPTGVGKTES